MAIASDFREKDKEIKAVWEKYAWFYPFLGGLLLLGIGFWLGMNWFAGDDGGLGYVTNLYTELLSIGVTIVVLDRINQYRERQNLKKRLVAEAGSRSQTTAVSAVDWLRREGWLEGDDGLLKDIDLRGANLAGVDLSRANLEGTNLWGTNLEGVNVGFAKLEGADLRGAKLEGANLRGAKLEGANLNGAKLEKASLWEANLEGADLRYAKLGGAVLDNANLDNTNLISTTLPDGMKWEEGVDMTKFNRTYQQMAIMGEYFALYAEEQRKQNSDS